MKKIIFYLFILLIVLSCSKDEDEILPYPDGDTLHEFELHANNRVSSLLMSANEYNSWLNNTEI